MRFPWLLGLLLGCVSFSSAAHATSPKATDTLSPFPLVTTDAGFVAIWQYTRADQSREVRLHRFGPKGESLGPNATVSFPIVPTSIVGHGDALALVAGSVITTVAADSLLVSGRATVPGTIAGVMRSAAGGLDVVSTVDPSTLAFSRFSATLAPLGEPVFSKKAPDSSVVAGGEGRWIALEDRYPDPARRSHELHLTRYSVEGTPLPSAPPYVTDEDAYLDGTHVVARPDGDLLLVPWHTLSTRLTYTVDRTRVRLDGTAERGTTSAWGSRTSGVTSVVGSSDLVASLTLQELTSTAEEADSLAERPARGALAFLDGNGTERRRVDVELPPLGVLASAACKADGCLTMSASALNRHELSIRYASSSGAVGAPFALDQTPSLDDGGCNAAGGATETKSAATFTALFLAMLVGLRGRSRKRAKA